MAQASSKAVTPASSIAADSVARKNADHNVISDGYLVAAALAL